MKRRVFLSAAIVCAAFGYGAVAAAQVPPAQTQNGVTFVTGGVGRDTARAFREAAADFNLRATFTAPGSAFKANVKVDLRDAQGKTLVATNVPGPFFFAKVPPGTYDMTASYGDQSAKRRLVVAAGGAAETTVTFDVPVGK